MPDAIRVDDLDARILGLLSEQPRIGVLGASRELGVARGTVQARLDRLDARGVVRSWCPDIDVAAAGYTVTAFATVEVEQGGGRAGIADALGAIPEVLEVHTITGAGDLWCRLVARSNDDLQRVIDAVVAVPGIERASTVIALAEQIRYRTLPLITTAASGRPVADTGTDQVSVSAAVSRTAAAATSPRTSSPRSAS